MPYGDGIAKINCYSLTDFHDFDECPLRFFVRHHLDRKYDIDESNEAIALGNLLDQSIKRFHKEEVYGTKSSQRLARLVTESAEEMRTLVEIAQLKGKRHFFEATIPFLTENVVQKATEIFTNYYVVRKGNVAKSLGEVGFCEWTIAGKSKALTFKLWGGPDTLELGEDGIPEIVDYKSRQGLVFDPSDHNSQQKMERAKGSIDMDLMPKIYTLLAAKKIQQMGYEKARFVVRFWQDPLDSNYYEEFDLSQMNGPESLFLQKIEKILSVTDFTPCNKRFCRACNSDLKDEFVEQLASLGLKMMSGEDFLEQQEKVVEKKNDGLFSGDLPF